MARRRTSRRSRARSADVGSPVLRAARRTARRNGSPTRSAACIRWWSSSVAMLLGLRDDRGALDRRSGSSSRMCSSTAWGIGAADERVDVWLAAHRTPARTEASLIGSIIAGGVVLPDPRRRDRARVRRVAQVADRGVRRSSRSPSSRRTYRATTLVVHSHRPRVVRLEHLPVNASYPSGHTAASIAVYGGLVLLLTSQVHERRLPRARLGDRRRDRRLRRAVAHVSRHAPSARRRRRDRSSESPR